jgi:hypothetical protein
MNAIEKAIADSLVVAITRGIKQGLRPRSHLWRWRWLLPRHAIVTKPTQHSNPGIPRRIECGCPLARSTAGALPEWGFRATDSQW